MQYVVTYVSCDHREKNFSPTKSLHSSGAKGPSKWKSWIQLPGTHLMWLQRTDVSQSQRQDPYCWKHEELGNWGIKKKIQQQNKQKEPQSHCTQKSHTTKNLKLSPLIIIPFFLILEKKIFYWRGGGGGESIFLSKPTTAKRTFKL